MSQPILNEKQTQAITTAIEAVIRVGILALIAFYCLGLLRPFLIPVLWGAILAVALFPLYLRVKRWVGGRGGLAATLISLVLILAITIPAVQISQSVFDSVTTIASDVESGTVKVPPPPAGVADWPVIGDKAYDVWSQARENLATFVEAFQPQIVSGVTKLLGLLASGGAAVLFTIISIIIAGAFMATSETCVKGLKAFAVRLSGDEGEDFVAMSGLVIRSVATGVIGVAVIQALLGGIGMAIVGVPLTIVWTLLLLIMAIAQIPALLIMGPVIVYVFATNDGVSATIFAVWGIFVSVSDGFLKPLLLGRGIATPTLVILLGAIGGMMLEGIIGLFVGAVVLALGWELLVSWVKGDVETPDELETGGHGETVAPDYE